MVNGAALQRTSRGTNGRSPNLRSESEAGEFHILAGTGLDTCRPVASVSEKLAGQALINCCRQSIMRRKPAAIVVSRLAAEIGSVQRDDSQLALGEVAEWLKAPLSKSGRQKCLVGSNPTLSASERVSAGVC